MGLETDLCTCVTLSAGVDLDVLSLEEPLCRTAGWSTVQKKESFLFFF